MTLVRVISTLSPELEDLVHRTIGAFLTVHRELGSGMSEGLYSAAAQIELLTRGIPFEHERTFLCDTEDTFSVISESICSSTAD